MSTKSSLIPGINQPNEKVVGLIVKLWGFLSHKRKKDIGILLAVMIISSLAEAVSLTAVLPFLAVLANPEGLWNKPIVQMWAPRLGINGPDNLLLAITICFALAAITSAAIRLICLYMSARIGGLIGSDISCETYRRTLSQRYKFHLSVNSSSIINTVTNDSSTVLGTVVTPLLSLVSSGLTLITLTTTLLIINWSISLGSGILILIAYLVAINISKKRLRLAGIKATELSRAIFKSLQEGLGAIREVVLNGEQKFYIDLYRKSDLPARMNNAQTTFLNQYPRLVLEPIGMVLIALIGYFLVLQEGVATALPILGAMALGAQRLLPMAQKVYEGWAQTKIGRQSLLNVLAILELPIEGQDIINSNYKLGLNDSIRLENVKFSYNDDLPNVLKGIDLTIKKGDRVGIIGKTGCGKSTTVDILMGLLEPTEGKILLDGEDLYSRNHPERSIGWRKSIAQVPQSIFLIDSTIKENIAFGIPKDQIDINKVKLAAKKAQIESFIESSKGQYEAFVGERGIRLSGGQRQRIGIARALYREAEVLIFDEATSALDTGTESAVIEAIEVLKRELTLIMISHRMETLSCCDYLIRIEDGKITETGTPKEILFNSDPLNEVNGDL